MKVRNMYIVLEGAPLSGKTTHAKNLCENLQQMGYEAVYYKLIPSNSKLGELLINLRNYNFSESFVDTLYLSDIILSDKRIRKDLKKGKFVIADRYIPSLESFTKTYRKGIWKSIFITSIRLLEKFLLEPNILFYLYCDYDEKIYRSKMKDDISSYDISLLSNKKILKKLESELKRCISKYKNVIEIDTSNKSVGEVDKLILSICLGCGKNERIR